ncbi:MAG: PQQ-binding-like beta-propeller repeat protein [Bryobacteraceae bacterium]
MNTVGFRRNIMQGWIQPLLFVTLICSAHAADRKSEEWPIYGGEGQTRYSPLKQINLSNIAKLKIAWTYDTNDGTNASQTHPIVVNGVLYGVTSGHKAIALDAKTGKLLWRFDSGMEGRGPNRGVTYWSSGNESRLFVTVQSFVYALDTKTGAPVPAFGSKGRIDLRENLGRDPEKQSLVLSTPGVIYKDLLILGGRTPEALPSPPGDIRAYDVRTGALRWSFHTIPHPGEFGYETWPKDAWTFAGSANSWPGMAVDQKRGIVYVPTGSPATDFYGADRVGDNLFANTLLALDAATGKRVWHFQAVKHDTWDRDFPSPPSLVTVKKDGKSVDAVAQTTKHGVVFLFDRVNGNPLFPIDYKKYPASVVPGEVSAETQGLPSKPAPFARQVLTADMLSNRTPEVHQWALDQFKTFRSEGQFIPLGTDREVVVFPGFDGGAEWGGSAFDPASGILYVNANDVAWTSSLRKNDGGRSARQMYLTNCAGCHRDDLLGTPPAIPSLSGLRGQKTAQQIANTIQTGAGRMPSFPSLAVGDIFAIAEYLLSGEDKELQSTGPTLAQPGFRFTGFHKWLDPDGFPAVAPPWGTLNAINLNTGEYAWKIPLGEYPELAEKGMKNTGTENYGGPIVTAGGLVFIGATNFDRKFRAFDKKTGKLVWETTLPMSGNATPVTYEAGGRQYVVIYSNGGRKRGDPSGGIYVAFALP